MNSIFTTMHKFISVVIVILFPLAAIAQQQERELPPNINQPSINLYAPYVSGDGNTLIYLSDYADDGHHTMYWTVRNGREWADGREINKLVNRPTLNLRGGYALNYAGDELYFTTRKSGLGGYDIWMSERQGSDWSAPRNLGAPLNTRANEGAPSLTADGTTMYYMECETMSEYKIATGCRIMVSRKVRGHWQPGTPLPGNINTGNAQMPRIMGDDHTMLFASDAGNAEGGFDIFMTRKEGESWSDPKPVPTLNGPGHDAFVSMSAKGRYVYRSRKGRRNMELVETLLPGEFRSERVMRISGTYTGPVEATLQVFNTDQRSRQVHETLQPGDEFSLVLKEGAWYDMSLAGESAGYEYFARIDDLTTVGRIDRENLSIGLRPVQAGDTISSSVEFVTGTSSWPERYDFELRRLAEFLKQNPSLAVDVHLVNPSFIQDSLPLACPYNVRYDTLYTPEFDSLALTPDPLAEAGRILLPEIDSMAIATAAGDTLRIPFTDISVVPVYHNDFTKIQTESITEFFTSRGIDTTRYAVVPLLIPVPDAPEDTYSFLESDPAEAPEPQQQPERLIAILRK